MGHEGILKLTDLREIFEDEGEDDAVGEAGEDVDGENEHPGVAAPELVEENKEAEDPDSDEPEPEEDHKSKKRKKKQTNDPLAKKREKKSRNQIVADPSFFSGL